MNSARFLKIIIAILVVLNLGTLSFLWLGAADRHGRGGEGPEGRISPGVFLTNELGLNVQQSGQYEQMRMRHHEQVEAIKENTMQYRTRLLALLKTSSTDTAAILVLTDSIARAQQNIELVTYYHFLELRNICNPQQQQKFNQVIEEVLRMMSPKPPPGR